MKQHRKIFEWIELFFDLGYLTFVLFAGVYFLISNRNHSVLYGAMALTLGFGDAFHLIPRIAVILTQDKLRFRAALGIGKLVTSITMTVVYLLLYLFWLRQYSIAPSLIRDGFVIGLAVIRIVLCLFPQNTWSTNESPLSWSVWRNVPFLFLGILLIGCFFYTTTFTQDGFSLMPIAITLSFACYLPVTILSSRYPAIGSLMLPKTMMYIWMVCMGFSLL